MRLLLDTHALLWAAREPGRLPIRARTAVADPANDVWASAASAWEVAIKRQLGKLTAPPVTPELVTHLRFRPLPISLEHAGAVEQLPLHHHDPFDRVLIAQAQVEGLTLVSGDSAIGAYDVSLLWD